MHLSRLVPTALLAIAAPLAGIHAQALSPYEPYVFDHDGSKDVGANRLAPAGTDGGLGHFEPGQYTPPPLSDFAIGGGALHKSIETLATAHGSARGWFKDEGSPGASTPDLPGSGSRGANGLGADDFASEFARLAKSSTQFTSVAPAIAAVGRGSDNGRADGNAAGRALGHDLNGDSRGVFVASVAQSQHDAAESALDKSDHGVRVGDMPQAVFHSPAFFDCTDDETPAECVTGFATGGSDLGSDTPSTSGVAAALFVGTSNGASGGTVAPLALTAPAVGPLFDPSAPVTATPEPTTLALFATGAAGLVGFVTRRKRNHKA